MRIIKPDLLHKDVHGQLVEHPVEGGQLPQRGESPPAHHVVHGKSERDSDDDLIEHHRRDHLQSVPLLNPLKLIGEQIAFYIL